MKYLGINLTKYVWNSTENYKFYWDILKTSKTELHYIPGLEDSSVLKLCPKLFNYY